jgi:hypothetical protein
LALLLSLMVFAVTASVARAGDGIVSASCSYNQADLIEFGPHVQIDSHNLWPTGNLDGQWVATKEFVHQYGTNIEVAGPWNIYWADRTGKWFEGTAPDFHISSGWWAARVVAYAWDSANHRWVGPTFNRYVQYDNGNWWCQG